MKTPAFKYARIGSISSGTLRTADLLSAYISTLEGLTLANGSWLSLPENHQTRDRYADLIGEAQDCFAENGEDIDPEKEDAASELVNEVFPEAFGDFCPSYVTFGAHPGDGADFGFWADVYAAREECEFVSWRSLEEARRAGVETDPENADYPPADFRGEWLHVNDHGNCTLYVREDSDKTPSGYTDRELWSVV